MDSVSIPDEDVETALKVERCTHCGWLIEYRAETLAWAHSDGRYFCWDTEDYKDPDYAMPRLPGERSPRNGRS